MLFVGGKFRLTAPIPYVAPFIDLGFGLSIGVLTTHTPNFDGGSSYIAYHVPFSVGLVLGKDQSVELELGYLVQPSFSQSEGTIALGLAFPLR